VANLLIPEDAELVSQARVGDKMIRQNCDCLSEPFDSR
jgi:hypothetical protein